MEISKYLDKTICQINIKAKNKEDILKKIAKYASRSNLLSGISDEEVYKKLLERENQGTTGFGNGIAIPHARIEGLEDFLIFIITSKTGIEYDTLDKKRVNIFIIILAPAEKVNAHLKILASISRLLTNPGFKRELLNAKTKDIIWETIIKYAETKEKKLEKRKMKLLFVILYLKDFLYDILEYFIEEGIEGATILESSGMGAYISNIPLFASFISFMREDKNQSKTIMALIPEDLESKIIQGIERITGDLDKKQGAMIITQDISFYKGDMRMM